MQKTEIGTIAEKNRIVGNIIDEVVSRDSFLLVGHRNPDEDCIASLVAMALLLSKFQKRVTIFTCSLVKGQLKYLLEICAYNSIMVFQSCEEISGTYSAMIILDTPKPSMIEPGPEIGALLADPDVRKIEIDHHLEADAAYAGDPGYCLVANASSTCELIGYLTLKLQCRTELIKRFGLVDLFSRNLALAILTGIVGDSKMGKFLKTRREHWYYRTFSEMFDKILFQKTARGSANLSSMEEIFNTIQSLSADEKACFDNVMTRRKLSRSVGYIVLDERESREIDGLYGKDIILTVTRAAADKLSDESGKLGLVVYYDNREVSNYIQFRLRRHAEFTNLDLRKVVEHFGIKNGGGHPGAVGFRIEKNRVSDIGSYMEELIRGIERMISAL